MQSQNIGNNLRNFLFSKSVLSRLVLINVAIWLLGALFAVISYLTQLTNLDLNNHLVNLFGLHSNIAILLKTPWTLFSYMFLHNSFWHLLFNMLMLYFGGVLFSRYLGQRRFVYTYFLGGLAGAIIFILSYNFFPAFLLIKDSAVIIGASAAVLAIFVGVATYMPNYEIQLIFFGKVKLKYLVIAFLVLDLVSISTENPGGHLAHLGGALYGFLSIWIPRVFRNNISKSVKLKKTKSKTTTSGRPLTDEQYNYNRAKEQNKIDAILDKISKSGYSSLSTEEKEILFKSK